MLHRQQYRSRQTGAARAVVRLAASLALAFVMVIAAAGIRPDHAAAANPQDEQLFVQMINDLRASKGLPALAVNAELTTEARSWANQMAADDQLAHSPNMASGITAKWSVLGENVGMHGVHDVQQLFRAFVNSPAHYQNLVDPRFNYIGVGVANTSEGKLWTTHRFMAAPTAKPTPPTTTTPTTPTTAPTTTTTADKTTPETAAPTTSPTTTPATAAPTTAKPAPTTVESTSPETAPVPQPTPTSSTTTAQPAEATDVDVMIVDDPTAGPSEPDVPTVEQVLVELAEAGI